MSNTVFSDHALNQLEERGISKKQAKEILNDPLEVQKKGKFRKIAQGWVEFQSKKYLLRVTYDEHEDFKEVVTCYRTSKFKKYLKQEL